MSSRTIQRDKILALLLHHRGNWVGLALILPLASQYNARILELRRQGWRIENKREHVCGQVHSWYRISPSSPQPKEVPQVDWSASPKHAGLFGDITLGTRYPD